MPDHNTQPDESAKLCHGMTMIRQGLELANRAVVSDIECNAVRVHLDDGSRWYDTRSMIDPREQPPEFIDMAVQALSFGQWAGLFRRHPQQPYLVRITMAGR